MAIFRVPFGEYLPDQNDLTVNGAVTASNVLPWDVGYISVPAFTELSTALTARAQGAFFTRDINGNVYNYAADATKLYQLTSGNSYSDVSRLVGGAYSTATDGDWEFSQWGQTIIAVNGTDAAQRISIGAANFIALPGSPPVARHIDVIRDFVVMGNISSATNRVQWSAINNSEDWAVSAATQADYQDIPDAGWIQRIVGGEYGLAMSEYGIWRMTYVGGAIIFQFDRVEKKRGLLAPQSAVSYGNNTFYLSDDGFYITNGSGPSVPIGAGKVDRTFLNDLQSSSYFRVSASIDPIKKMVLWAYPGSGSSNGTPNKILAYNWQSKKWAGPITQDMEIFARYAALGYTLDGLDAVNSSLDALSASLDSRIWTGGAQTLAGFSTGHKLGTFSGTAMSATVDTTEQQHFPGYRANVTTVRPLVDANAASITVGSRNRQADTRTYGAASTQASDGHCDVRSNARYHVYRATTSGDFDFIQGLDIEASRGDQR